jgi:hypothetical protein
MDASGGKRGARRLVGTVIVALYLPVLSVVDALACNRNPF